MLADIIPELNFSPKFKSSSDNVSSNPLKLVTPILNWLMP
jgi:hypothetical protein|nr:MAG TPA: hypothetical protein [Caudoviricetes sp.]